MILAFHQPCDRLLEVTLEIIGVRNEVLVQCGDGLAETSAFAQGLGVKKQGTHFFRPR